jgi:ATP-dependent DNA helicase RecG
VSIVFGPDPVIEAVQAVLDDLDAGKPVRERIRVDLKEEAGRRDRAGAPLPGGSENETAARALAGAAACMANTPGAVRSWSGSTTTGRCSVPSSTPSGSAAASTN